MDIIAQADRTYKENFAPVAWFERAIFISWFCARPTCNFCYMYTIKDKIKNPRKARRRLESILAEALICRICDWEVGFLSAGIASWSTAELKPVLEGVCKTTGKKQWLNLGALRERQIKELLPYIQGVTGTVETVNYDIRDSIVPDKPLPKIEEMFQIADKYKLRKSITIIIGLGETVEHFQNLAQLIRKWRIDRVNFYRLVPHEGSPYKHGPNTDYYAEWIARTRIEFPKIEIIAGSWPDRTEEIPVLLKAGANAITKLPAIKLFGREPAKRIQLGAKDAGREFKSELIDFPDVDVEEIVRGIDLPDEMKSKILRIYAKYSRRMAKNK